MQKNGNKKEWTEEVMRSLDGLERASAPSGLFEQIQNRIQQPVRVISISAISAAAACLLLLIALNFMAASRLRANEQQPAQRDVQENVPIYPSLNLYEE